MNNGVDNVSILSRIIQFCLHNKLILLLVSIGIILWGILVSPFDWNPSGFPRHPIPVDAIPDLGENQQIVFTKWPGHSPQDVEDQITYPLTSALMGTAGVKTVRSNSMFGFSTIYVIFHDTIDFYWSRSRILEKLNSLPAGILPEGIHPKIGPDATALGQIFWYTLEGRDQNSQPTGGWDLHELRRIQDWTVRYALTAVNGVAEVASIGGFVQEYQIDIDPDKMKANKLTLHDILTATKHSNLDISARTIEINKVEYVIRGLGLIKNVRDIANSVISSRHYVPIRIKDIANVHLGPALRRGVLDKGGTEAVGAVVVARYGSNPMEVIKKIKAKIKEISPGLPEKILPDGTVSKLTIVPFYDRTALIKETLGTLSSTIEKEILITILVVLIMVWNLRASILISSLLPLAVLICFIAMKTFHIDANIIALSGIAIAIGTMVDMAVVICENILKHMKTSKPTMQRSQIIFNATSEVSGAVLTAVLTTIIGFLPVFVMSGMEGKLFTPLAYTKTFALVAAIGVSLLILPSLALLFFASIPPSLTLSQKHRKLFGVGLIIFKLSIILFVIYYLSTQWQLLDPIHAYKNFLFIALLIACFLGVILFFQKLYPIILQFCLEHKGLFLALPLGLVLWGFIIWLGVDTCFGFMPESVKDHRFYSKLQKIFPGLDKEFMPSFDEGAFLFMPTTMPHASIGEAMDILQTQDMAIQAIPEVDTVVGKIGRVDSALDPAPVSMIETLINYKSEYRLDVNGEAIRFKYDKSKQEYIRDSKGQLIPDNNGRIFRQWRQHIQSPDDIWKEIIHVASIPGATSAPKLQPISTRLVMLQSGLRAPMGIKIKGPDLKAIEKVGLEIEHLLKQVPSVSASTVIADRIIGKPYLEIDIDREVIARYGMTIQHVQEVIEVAIGGKNITHTIEGRERFSVRIRYLRELRNDIDSIGKILVSAANGSQIPLIELADIHYRRGPHSIKSEDNFLVGYVVFDKQSGHSESDVIQDCQRYLDKKREQGELNLAAGVSYSFTGTYEHQVRSEQTLRFILPLTLSLIFIILFYQFRSISITFVIFSGILVAGAGGFIMLWLYDQDWFLNINLFDKNLRELFHIDSIKLSIAVWVGFLALFGIATDDGVIMSTYIQQSLRKDRPSSIPALRKVILSAGQKRIRPCLMTSATTFLALLPIFSSTGKGADIMIPMAIPSFGGMLAVMISVFVVPTLYCAIEEYKSK